MRCPTLKLFPLSLTLALGSASILEGQTMLHKFWTCSSKVSEAPRDYTTVGKLTFFVANRSGSGVELWRTDGTGAGTLVVKDIRPGAGSSSPKFLTDVNGKLLFFIANDGVHGEELWVSDGSAKGTVMVRDMISGPSFSSPRELVAFGGVLMFSGQTTATGRELWKSDGTAAGTVLVRDIEPGQPGSGPEELTVNGKGVYFRANTKNEGLELWISDGSTSGTRLVKDIRTGTLSSAPRSFEAANGTVFFAANDGSNLLELWKTDGTSAGTKMVRDIHPGSSSNPTGLTANGRSLFFVADDGKHGRELWKSDGTPTGTAMVRDSNVGSGSSGIQDLTSLGSFVYYTDGFALGRSDGSTAGTYIVKSIRDGVLARLTAVNGILFFQAGKALWRSSGTTASTVRVRSFTKQPASFAAVGGKLMFTGPERAVWLSDGTSRGTALSYETESCTSSDAVLGLTEVNGRLLFSGEESATGDELWMSDGTAAGTRLVQDLQSRSGSSSPHSITQLGTNAYFAANRRFLYRSDGTVPGTQVVWKGYTNSTIETIISVDGTLYFFSSGQAGVSDGTSSGSRLVSGPNTGPANGSATLGGVFYYSGFIGVYKIFGNSITRIWGARSKYLTRLGNSLYFTIGGDLWKSDGSSSGTARIKTLNGPVGPFVKKGNSLYFPASDTSNGNELWMSDGTGSGTVRLKDINVGVGSSSPRELTILGNAIYFIASDGKTGDELWVTDGTATGTKLVKDIYPGPISSQISGLAVVGAGTRLVFAAGDPERGVELWQSDGTASGTVHVADISKGAGSSNPGELTEAGSDLFFTADDGWNGRQLWVIPLSQLDAPVVQRYGVGCLGRNGIPQNDAVGAPTLGSSSFAVTVSEARRSAGAILFFGANRSNLDVGNGCSIYVSPILVSVGTTTNSTGEAKVSLAIPNSSALLGVQAFLQWAIDDPTYGAYHGTASLSGGLQVMIGR
jgi:ELWxxDGT repeat protein